MKPITSMLEAQSSGFDTGPVVLYFHASWCQPCKQVKPLLNELSETYADMVKVFSIDVEDNNELMNAFGVRALPTVIFLADGDRNDTLVGNAHKSALQDCIDSIRRKS